MAINHGPVPEHAHEYDAERLADLFRVLSEPHRLEILQLLAHGELRITDLTERLGLAQSTVSAHIAQLRERGLVTTRPEGRATWHRVSSGEVDRLLIEAEHVLEELDGEMTPREQEEDTP